MRKGLRKSFADFYSAYRKGWPQSRRLLYVALQWLLGAAGLAAVIFALLNIPNIQDIALRTLAWALVILFLIFVAAVLGLTPYWGQRAITEETKTGKDAAIDKLNSEIDSLGRYIALRRRQQENPEQFISLEPLELLLRYDHQDRARKRVSLRVALRNTLVTAIRTGQIAGTVSVAGNPVVRFSSKPGETRGIPGLESRPNADPVLELDCEEPESVIPEMESILQREDTPHMLRLNYRLSMPVDDNSVRLFEGQDRDVFISRRIG